MKKKKPAKNLSENMKRRLKIYFYRKKISNCNSARYSQCNNLSSNRRITEISDEFPIQLTRDFVANDSWKYFRFHRDNKHHERRPVKLSKRTKIGSKLRSKLFENFICKKFYPKSFNARLFIVSALISLKIESRKGSFQNGARMNNFYSFFDGDVAPMGNF